MDEELGFQEEDWDRLSIEAGTTRWREKGSQWGRVDD